MGFSMKKILAFLFCFGLFACENSESESKSQSSQDIAGELNLLGKWLSPCIPFDGKSIKKLHEFGSDDSLKVSVVEFSDDKCSKSLKVVEVGSYSYSLSEQSGQFAYIDIKYPNHKEYGVVMKDGNGLKLVYGTDSKEDRAAINLSDVPSVKSWKKMNQ